jgi:hypothetical protein
MHAVRIPAVLRRWLAVWLAGLMLAAAGAPCTGVTAPARPAVSRPADPCDPATTNASAACAQLACQVALEPQAGVTLAAPEAPPVPYARPAGLQVGRRDPPPDPPPRLPMS